MPAPTPVVLRARRALVRPLVRRTLIALVAVATGVTVASLVRSAEGARRAWGASRPVAVATHDLAVGEVLGAGAAEVHDLPVAAVADRALGRAPVGATVRHPVAAGEALVAERLAPLGLTGAAALVPPGSRALAVPLGPAGAPPLAVGDLVDVLAVSPPEAGGGPAASAVVGAVPVVATGDESASVAVPRDDVPAVAHALAQGAVVLALVGP